MLPAPKNNAAASYQGPGKIELSKGAGLLTRNTATRSHKMNPEIVYCGTNFTEVVSPYFCFSFSFGDQVNIIYIY